MSTSQPDGKTHKGRVAGQILDDLRGQILSGALQHGTKLPAERFLAAHYGVSGPTIREAIRLLTAMGLVNCDNGTSTTVTAQSDTLIAASIAAVVQFRNLDIRDIIGLLGVLNAHAAELAARRASSAEVAALRDVAQRAAGRIGANQSVTDLKDYFLTLSAISHNPLLTALFRFITDAQIELSDEFSSGDQIPRQSRTGEPNSILVDIANAIDDRDPDRAAKLVKEYHEHIADRIQSSPPQESPTSDPGFSEFLSTWLGTGGD